MDYWSELYVGVEACLKGGIGPANAMLFKMKDQ